MALEEELKKVEAKLLAAVREKTSSVSTATTLERQCVELKKINNFLKSKVCSSAFPMTLFYRPGKVVNVFWNHCLSQVSADTTKKRINSLTMELMEARNSLDVKNKVDFHNFCLNLL